MVDISQSDRLLEAAQRGDKDAENAFVECHAPLVRSVAKRFLSRYGELDDLMQIGFMGLIKAMRQFDKARGFAFSTYAYPLIVGEIKRFLRDDGILKVSRKQKSDACVIVKARDQYMACHGEEPTLSALSEMTSWNTERVTEALSAYQSALTESEEALFAVADKNSDSFTARLLMKDALGKLDAQSRKLAVYRYLYGYTQRETAKILGISQVQVSRKEKKAAEILREYYTNA